PRLYAIMEYVMLGSYGVFHLTSLIDIRHLTFLCYPRTCSGECEPLDPRNFGKDAKYEHCRAYEYQQRLDYSRVDEPKQRMDHKLQASLFFFKAKNELHKLFLAGAFKIQAPHVALITAAYY
ncbi:hypothetical protein OESDEN_18198, partial [Oesophagostomum dentatum]